MHFRIKPNFSHRRTYGRMSVRGSMRHCRSVMPSTENTHQHTLFIHRTVCCQTVRDRPRRDYTKPIFIYAIHTRVENILQQKRNAIIRRKESQDEDVRIALGANHSS